MSDFGTIVLVPFPFTDLTDAKVRPALVLSRKPSKEGNVVVCFITSRMHPRLKHAFPIPADSNTGLKVPSRARLDKLATLDLRIILGELGRVSVQQLRKHRSTFFGIFGF